MSLTDECCVQEAREYLLEKGGKVKKLFDMFSLIEEVREEYDYDYAVAPVSIGIVCGCLANYLSNCMGLTGFQASHAMWEFIKTFTKRGNKCGLELVDYDDMLYPQYSKRFEKTIPKESWEKLQETAKNLLETTSDASEDVIKHWERIANGEIPFGYKIAK